MKVSVFGEWARYVPECEQLCLNCFFGNKGIIGASPTFWDALYERYVFMSLLPLQSEFKPH